MADNNVLQEVNGNSAPDPVNPSPSSNSVSSEHQNTLRQVLKERHVNMIAFTATIGVGLFLQSGRVIFLAGPGMAFFAYILMGTVVWSTVACLGEMTALFPVQGPIFEFPGRFLDEGVGYTTGWMTWFSWTIVIAVEILAVTQLWRFKFDETYLRDVGYPDSSLGWGAGQDTKPAVWVSVFLIFILLVNTIPVLWYGRLEYIFGVTKMLFIVGLIMFNLILNARQIVPHATRFWTYNEPYSFTSQNYTLNAAGDVIRGSPGRFLGMWSGMTTTIFSLIGFETVAITAAENRDLQNHETIKLATRKISLRIILLYTLCVFTVGLNVPYTDPNLRDLTVSSIHSGQDSAFILAAARNHIRSWPNFFNGFFIFSATTSGISSLYISSRVLHALASVPEAWPAWGFVESFRLKLRRTMHGVPLVAVFVSWCFGCLAFLSSNPSPAEILGRLATHSAASMLIVYAIINASYLNFYRIIDRTARGQNTNQNFDNNNPALLHAYDRSNRRYPYRSHLQWLRAFYALIFCCLMAIFNGWRTFVHPMSTPDFIASYISIVIFIALTTAYQVMLQGWNPLRWVWRPTMELQAPPPMVIDQDVALHRRGVLWLPDTGLTQRNLVHFGDWVWTWMK